MKLICCSTATDQLQRGSHQKWFLIGSTVAQAVALLVLGADLMPAPTARDRGVHVCLRAAGAPRLLGVERMPARRTEIS